MSGVERPADPPGELGRRPMVSGARAILSATNVVALVGFVTLLVGGIRAVEDDDPWLLSVGGSAVLMSLGTRLVVGALVPEASGWFRREMKEAAEAGRRRLRPGTRSLRAWAWRSLLRWGRLLTGVPFLVTPPAAASGLDPALWWPFDQACLKGGLTALVVGSVWGLATMERREVPQSPTRQRPTPEEERPVAGVCAVPGTPSHVPPTDAEVSHLVLGGRSGQIQDVVSRPGGR